MRIRNLALTGVALLGVMLSTTAVSAQDAAPRFGAWKMKSDAPPPSINVMTYTAYGDGGMSVTVESTNAQGRDNKWGYMTMFDGEFRAVDGRDGAKTAVEFVDERTTRISNMTDGRVTQVIINILSEDGNTISNEYVRLDADGKITGVSHAIYERIR
jgi:hypothetical protein